MTVAIGAIGMPEIVAAIIVVALTAYALTGGADYGGGVWDLLATGSRRDAQRALIAKSIGPIWEANHVWLIVVVVVLFTGFPVVFGTLGTVLHIPLTLMLLGIVLRGSAFMFRSYGTRDHVRRRWGAAFAVASVITPMLLGDVIGAIASGAVMSASARVGSAPFADVFIAPWLAPFPVAVGVFAVALFAFLAGVYLTLEADDDALRSDFRTRALFAAGAVFVFAAVALLLSMRTAPNIATGLTAAAWSIPLHVATGVAAVTAIVALWRRTYRLARAAAGTQVALILWGWAASQYPFVLPPTLRIRDAAAPRETLSLLLAALAAGGALLVPSLWYLMRTFARGKGPNTEH